MSGVAKAQFICGVHDCDALLTTDLVNDGWYTSYGYHETWHIELGTKWKPEDKGSDTIVRCPNHCQWVTKSFTVNFDGFGNRCDPREVTEGKWEDDQ